MNERKTGGTLSNFCLLVMFIYCSINIMPIGQVLIPPLYSEALLLLWFLLSILCRLQNRSKFSFLDSSFLVVFFIVLCYKLFNISNSSWGTIFNSINFLFSVLMIEFSIKVLNDKQVKCLFWGLFFVITLYTLYCIIASFVLSDYSELLIINSNEEQESMRSRLNLGDTQHDMMVLFYFCVSYLLWLFREKWKFFFLILSLLAGYYIIFVSQRASISIYLLFAFIALPIVIQDAQKRSTRTILFLLIGFLIILIFGNDVISFLKSILPERISERLLDIDDSVNHGVSGDSFSGRAGLIIMSIDTWLSGVDTFFFGIGERYSQTLDYSAGTLGVGGHADGFDLLGKFGILGWSAVMIMFFRFRGMVLHSIYSLKCKRTFSFLFLFFMICFFTKTVFFIQVGIGAVILVPLCFYMEDHKLLHN